ncbi:MAG TPA: TolC family protein [Opitutales bacterium]|nr:TolC family protein [Opitutales bacterium]
MKAQISILASLRTAAGSLVALAFAAAGASAEDAAPLDLRSSVVAALGANYLVQADTLAVEQADARVSGAWGEYDPGVFAGVTSFRQAQSSGNYLQGEGTLSEAGVQLQAPTGTSVAASGFSYRMKDYPGESSRFTGVSLEVRQKLLRGFGFGVNMAPIRIASKNAAISREVFREEVSQLVQAVQFAYFDVLLAEENARVSRESCDLANRLYEENRKRESIGSMAGSDIFQTRAELAARRENLFEAELALGNARNRLRLLMASTPQAATGMEVVIAPLPEPGEIRVDAKADFTAALAQRPDYRKAVLGLERDQIDALRAGNSALPDMEAFASMRMFASGDDFDSSYAGARHMEDKDFTLGARMNYSIPNRSGWADRAVAKRQARIAKLTLRQLEMEIAVSLDDGARRIDCDWKRLVTARESRGLAEQSLRAEEKLYDAGNSSTFVILRLQTDLMNAQLRELVAENDYRKAVVEYQRLCGTLLDGWNIVMP